MKRILSIVLILSYTSNLSAQNINGTWAGIMYNEIYTLNKYFFLEVKQKDRTLWGVYTTTDSIHNKTYDCLCSVSGQLPEKAGASFEIFQKGVIDYDTQKIMLSCESIAHMDIHYLIEDSIQYMVGKWYREFSHAKVGFNKGGYIILQHLSTGTAHNIDKYFSNLDKMIRKGATDGKSPAIVADDISLSTADERKLMDIWKRLLKKIQG